MVGWIFNVRLEESHERIFTESKIAMVWLSIKKVRG